MEYLSPREASKKWNICLRRVQCFCADGRIPGVIKMGRQWLIPITAEKPEDGRRKAAPKPCNAENYRFPVFVYSDCYVARSDLTEEETMLCQAQISLLQNNYTQCISECRKLTAEEHPAYIRFGAYCTILYASVVLGLYSVIVHCRNMLNALYEQYPDNEDYKLLITALKLQYAFDYGDIQNIDPLKLSTDALILYQLINLETLIFNKDNDCNIVENLCQSLCCRFKIKGISPAVMITYGVMALFYQRNGNAEKMRFCIDEVCRIGHDEGLIKLLTKNSALSSEEYRQSLLKYGTAFADEIQTLHQQNIIGFQTVFGAMRNEPFFKDGTPEENEILLLLSYGFSNKAIAEMKNISTGKISKTIAVLCNRFRLHTRKELVDFAKRIYNGQKG